MRDSSDPERFLRRPFRHFFQLWIPVLFSLIAEPLTGLVDTAFISRLGAEALAALGVGTMVLSSVFWIFNFLSVGSQTEVSQARGRQDLDRGRRIGSLAVIMAASAGVLLAVSAAGLAAFLASAMGASGLVHDQAVQYIQVRAAGAPAVLMSLTAFGILYGLQDMRTPLMVALLVNALNIVLDALLIFGLGPLPALGIAGAALASVVSQYVGAAVGLYCVVHQLGFTVRIRIGDVSRLVQVGADMFVRTGMLTLFLLLATRAATRIGPEAGAAHQAIRQVWVFTALFLDASAIAAQSLIGYFFGSGRLGDARSVAWLVCQWSVLIGFVLMLTMLAGRHVAAAGLVPASGLGFFYPAWTVAALMQPLCALAFVTDGIHWGTGDFRFLRNVVIVATASGVLWLWILDETGAMALTGIWLATGAWIVIRTVCGIWRIWPGMKNSPLSGT